MIFSYTKDRYLKLLTSYSDLVYSSKKRALYDAMEIERLKTENARLKQDIKMKDEVLHYKNLALDALHFVWCNGSCKGVHVYDTQVELTEEQAESFFRNVYRILCKFDLSKFNWSDPRKKDMTSHYMQKVTRILNIWTKKDDEN